MQTDEASAHAGSARKDVAELLMDNGRTERFRPTQPPGTTTSCHINGLHSFPIATSFAFKAEESLSAFHLPQQKVGKKKEKKKKGEWTKKASGIKSNTAKPEFEWIRLIKNLHMSQFCQQRNIWDLKTTTEEEVGWFWVGIFRSKLKRPRVQLLGFFSYITVGWGLNSFLFLSLKRHNFPVLQLIINLKYSFFFFFLLSQSSFLSHARAMAVSFFCLFCRS